MARLDISADKTNINKNDTVTFTVTNTLTSITNVFIGNTVIDSDSTSTHTFTYTFTAIGEYTVVLKEFNKIYDSWITIKSIVITVSEPPTGSWSIGNKTVQSLTIGNKKIQTIERVSDGAIIYQRKIDTHFTLINQRMIVLNDENDNPVPNKTIRVYCNGGTSYSDYITNANNPVTVDGVIYSAIFNGDSLYNGCEYSQIAPAVLSISATKDVLSKSHSNRSTLTATVLDTNNNPCKDKTVTFKKGSTVLGTDTTDANGQAEYTYLATGDGDITITVECGLITETYDLSDYLLVPPLDGTDGVTKWSTLTNNTNNGVFNSHGSYLSNGWNNTGLWQLDFDVKTSNWWYVGLMPICVPAINPFTDAKNNTYSIACWEGFTCPNGMGFSNIGNAPSYTKKTATNTTYHMTIKKTASNRIEIILENNSNYTWIKESSLLSNYSTLYFGSRDNPSSRNSGGVLQFSNIVVKPLIYSLTADLSSSTINNGQTTTISGRLINKGSPMANETITIYDGNTSLGTCTTDSNGVYSKTLSEFSANTHMIKASHTNVDSSTVILTVTGAGGSPIQF